MMVLSLIAKIDQLGFKFLLIADIMYLYILIIIMTITTYIIMYPLASYNPAMVNRLTGS